MNSSTKKKISYLDLSSDSTPLEWLGLKARRAAWCSAAASLPVCLGLYANVRAGDLLTDAENTATGEPDNGNCRKWWPMKRRNGFLLPHQATNDDLINELAGGDDCPGNAVPAGSYTQASPFRDSGSTVGSNNTVNNARFINYCYYSYNANGPDQIYSFTLTGRGTNPKIEVTTTSQSYQPMIYVLETRDNQGCPAGTGTNNICRLRVAGYAPAPGATATLDRSQMEQLPLNVPLFLFIDSERAGPNEAGPYTVRMQDVGIAPAPPPPPAPPQARKFDFDGDGRGDISVFRPSDGFWHVLRSNRGPLATELGISTDTIVPADYDGDGKTDIAVFRDGTWIWLNSSNGVVRQAGWGFAGDTPQPADFSGDGKAELAIFRNGTWFTYNIQTGRAESAGFGLAGDRPVAGDYDGDGKAEHAVYRNGRWILRVSTGFTSVNFGLPTDRLVPADYDGDGKTDLAVFRDGIWYVLGSIHAYSAAGFSAFQFGIASDTPVPADYDGDDRADAAVYRDGIWYLRQPAGGFEAIRFGLATDRPVPGALVR